MPDFERLDSISWDAVYMRAYSNSIKRGEDDDHSHEEATGYVHTLRNICAGACMTVEELEEERIRFAKEADEVEKDLKRLLIQDQYDQDLAEMKRRRRRLTMSTGTPRYRLAGTLDKKMCDYHKRDVTICSCGYVRPSQVKFMDRKELVEIHEDGTPVDSQKKMFGGDE